MRRNWLWLSVILVTALVVFTSTLAPGIFWEDSASFVTASYVLGIPHSPGFPIYVLLGRVFTLLPIDNPAWAVNLMSPLFAGLGLALLFLFLAQIISTCYKKTEIWTPFAISALVLFLGFTTSFWSQTFRAEVYSLNFLFTIILTYLVFRWSTLWKTKPVSATRAFFLFAFLFGLGCTNHSLLIAGLLPAFLVYIVLTDYKFILKAKNLLWTFFFGFLGLTPYLYLLIRSRHNPALNWGKPDNWVALFKVVTRSDSWQGGANISQVNLWTNFLQLINFINSELTLPVFILGLVGLYFIARKSLPLGAMLIAMLATNLFVVSWAAEFSTRNLDLLGYLLPSLTVLTIGAVFGLVALLGTFKAKSRAQERRLSPALAGLVLLIPVYNLATNYTSNNQSQNQFPRQYALALAEGLPQNSVVISSEDNTLTPLWYLTLVEKNRPDVVPLAWNALDNLDYLKTVKLSHRNLIVPAKLSKGRWVEKFNELNQKNPLYLQYVDLSPQVESRLLPSGYLLRLDKKPVSSKSSSFVKEEEFLSGLFQKLRTEKALDPLTREHYGDLFFNWGVFFDRRGKGEISMANFQRALEIDSANDRLYTALGKGFLKAGRAKEAEQFLRAAIGLAPYNRENYRLLDLCLEGKTNPQKQN